MPGFSDKDIQDAKRRVEEMRKRARGYASSEPDSKNELKPEPELPPPPPEPPKRDENKNEPFSTLNILSRFVGDYDKNDLSIILVLLLLLSRNGADNALILALLYILL